MIPPFEKFGLLPTGIHWVEWDEFAVAFGSTPRRRKLLIAEAPADLEGKTFLDYFQQEVRRGVLRRKGIIGIRLRT